MKEINSQEYWEQRFVQDWSEHNGARYTYFHGEVLLRHLPEWLAGEIAGNQLSICDWGCAEGEAVNIFASHFPGCKVTGVDFAPSAIASAGKKFPDRRFICQDWCKDENVTEKYDVIYSSHTLEHFRSPFEIIRSALLKRANKYLVIMVPFAENPEKMDPEHYFRFIPEVIPQKIANWNCVYYKVINSLSENDYWKGIQTLLVFANSENDTSIRTLAAFSGESGWLKEEVKTQSGLCEQLKKELFLEQEKRRLQIEHDKVLLSQNEKLNLLNASQKEMIAAKSAEIENLKAARTADSGKLKVQENNAAELQTKCSSIQQELNRALEKIKELQGRLSAKESEFIALQTKCLNSQMELNQAQNRNFELLNELSEKKSTLSAMESKCSADALELTQIQTQSAEKTAELDAARKKIAALETQVNEKESLLDSTQEKIAALETQVNEKESLLTQVQSKVSELETQVNAKGSELTQVQSKVSELQTQVNARGSELTQAQKKVSELQTQANARGSELTQAQNKIKELQNQVNAKGTELTAQQTKCSGTQQELSKAQSKIRELQAQLSISNASREELWLIQKTRSYRAVQKINRMRYKIYNFFGKEYPRGDAKKTTASPQTTAGPVSKPAVPAASAGKVLKKLRVGAIMDQFSYSSFEPECDLFTFRVDNWKEIFEAQKPDFLMVESAWNGNEGAWQYRIGTYSGSTREALFELLDYCKKINVPTVFWNKEDPPHFDKFIEAASRFDYVFTTDENCIPLYQKQCGHNRVYALPFAAQPILHNPVLTEARDKNICFAGTYYATRFEDRRARMDVLFKASEKLGLDIYDRQFGNTGPGFKDYLFPENLRKFILGRLEYDDMVKAYRRYKIFLNVNSVENSRTMFSRRVFELLACGTPTVTTPSDGIKHFFGDLVPEITDPRIGYEIMKKIIEDNEHRRRLSAAGVRCVIGKHTYAHRMEEVCKTVGISLKESNTTKTAVVLHNVRSVDSVITHLKSQKLAPAVIIGLKVADSVIKKLKNNGWDAVAAASTNEVISLLKKDDSICAVALWNGCDAYTSEYLADALLALNNFSCDVTGMCAVQEFAKKVWTPSGDFSKENFMVDTLYTDTLVFRPGAAQSALFIEAALREKRQVSAGSGYARSAFEYGAGACDLKNDQLKEIIL